jgi:hypothetical protein
MKYGEKGFLTVHRAVAYASQAVEFAANADSPSFTQLQLDGEMETPSGYSEPYTFDDDLVYATS